MLLIRAKRAVVWLWLNDLGKKMNSVIFLKMALSSLNSFKVTPQFPPSFSWYLHDCGRTHSRRRRTPPQQKSGLHARSGQVGAEGGRPPTVSRWKHNCLQPKSNFLFSTFFPKNFNFHIKKKTFRILSHIILLNTFSSNIEKCFF